MSLPINATGVFLPCGFTNGGQARGGQYWIIHGVSKFQYQLPAGAYWIGGDLRGKLGENASRYFLAC